MNISPLHDIVRKAMDELGDDYEYEKFRELLLKYIKAERMKKFLKVAGYEEKE